MTADQLLETRDVCCGSTTDLQQPRRIVLSIGNPLSIFVMSRSRLLLDQSLLGTLPESGGSSMHFFSTRNAFITTQSCRDILPIKIC